MRYLNAFWAKRYLPPNEALSRPELKQNLHLDDEKHLADRTDCTRFGQPLPLRTSMVVLSPRFCPDRVVFCPKRLDRVLWWFYWRVRALVCHGVVRRPFQRGLALWQGRTTFYGRAKLAALGCHRGIGRGGCGNGRSYWQVCQGYVLQTQKKKKLFARKEALRRRSAALVYFL